VGVARGELGSLSAVTSIHSDSVRRASDVRSAVKICTSQARAFGQSCAEVKCDVR